MFEVRKRAVRPDFTAARSCSTSCDIQVDVGFGKRYCYSYSETEPKDIKKNVSNKVLSDWRIVANASDGADCQSFMLLNTNYDGFIHGSSKLSRPPALKSPLKDANIILLTWTRVFDKVSLSPEGQIRCFQMCRSAEWVFLNFHTFSDSSLRFKSFNSHHLCGCNAVA